MQSFIREPVIQFLCIGVVLYLVTQVLSLSGTTEPSDTRSTLILTTETSQRIEQAMVAKLAKRGVTLQAGSEQYTHELDKAIDNYVLQELFFREALTNNLGENDPKIRTRLINKAKLLAIEKASLAPITEQEITAYYQQHIAQFTTPKTLDLWQLFFDKNKHNEQTNKRCQAALDAVTKAPNSPLDQLATQGDRSAKYRLDMRHINQDQLSQLFGVKPAGKVFTTPPGTWYGLVHSLQGCHIFKILKAHPRTIKPLDEVKANIVQAIENQQNTQALNHYGTELRAKYEVRIEG